MRRKLEIKIFKNFKEQEEADIIYYKNLSPEKKLLELEEMRKFFFKINYGYIPRLRRVCRVTKKK